MTVDSRAARIAKNEGRFREINETLEAGLRKLPEPPDVMAFVCECGRRDCAQMVELSFDEYEAVRRNSRHFAVVPGHEFPDVEDVVERHDRYFVVEKHEDTRPIVESSDPRRSDRPEG